MTKETRKEWRRQFISIEPTLLVRDLTLSRDYFFRSLHFYSDGITYRDKQPYYCQMFRGAASLGLYQMVKPEACTPRSINMPDDFCDLTFWIADLDQYIEEIRPDGPKIIREPYLDTGIKKMIVGSLDGHRLCLLEDQWRDDTWPPVIDI